ncbi:uncharacterized protein LOC134066541 [Sardina pilchardus]|uniref:uncharacterized protein LOC134066541 n=1 Tax=Sardina pilchardus TaxID=27697 RepID=UPI002E0D3C51
MLRKSVSDRSGLHRTEQLNSAANQNDSLGPLLKNSEELKTDQASSFNGHPTGSCGKGVKQALEQRDVLQAAEEEEIWNSLDINPEQKSDIVQLLQGKSRLMGMNANLQKALNACEDSNAELEVQNTDLKNQMISMNKAIKAMEQYRIEMDEMRAALAESQMANSSLKTQNNKLEKENKGLSNVIEANNNEMSDVLFACDANKKKTVDLTQHIKTLEKQLEQTRVELEEQGQIIINKDFMIDQQKASLEEMNSIGLNLKAKIKDLENQLEMALVTGRGSFLKQDGTFDVGTENHLSLADELGQLSGFQNSASLPLYQVEFDDDDVEEDESVEFELDVMEGSHVQAWADELKEALEEDACKEKEEAVTCKSMEMTLGQEMEEAASHEEVNEVINHVEVVKEEVADETVEVDISCEEMVQQEMRQAQEPEVMEQLIRQGDIHKSIKLEMAKAAAADSVDAGAERPVQAQISLLEEENKTDDNSGVCLEQTRWNLQRAALVTGAVGLGLLIFLKIKA